MGKPILRKGCYKIKYILSHPIWKIKKYAKAGVLAVDKFDLINYYKSFLGQREVNWSKKLGKDLNWTLSFDTLKEKDTTKHVHRLHPYKGKFIPQLVEYFLDDHIDDFKKEVCFRKGDIVLDPFAGSGTTLVQANELDMHAIGIDISAFNALITNVKIGRVDFPDLCEEIAHNTEELRYFVSSNNNLDFENALLEELNRFNKKYFPSPEFKIRVREKQINEKKYTVEKETEFLPIFERLCSEYNLKITQDKADSFLEKWYLQPVRQEIDFVFDKVRKIKNPTTKKIIAIILSRTMRSCRATTHADLGTLKEPVTRAYYCRKHGKMCKPLFSILQWWRRYSEDVVERLREFDTLRTSTHQTCLQGDARTIDIFAALSAKNRTFATLARKQKIRGIFSSPPYVGLINYHEQHAYAYDLFGFDRHDELEIGPLFNGQGKEARDSYTQSIVQVLVNSKKYLQDNYDIFLVANDKYKIYPIIADEAGLQIINQYKRPVLNRTERDKSAYSEIIFHMKEK